VAAGADASWELYNLVNDRTESDDLAARHPQKVRELRQAWTQRQAAFRELALQDLSVGDRTK